MLTTLLFKLLGRLLMRLLSPLLMTQTTGAITFKDVKLEFSTDGAAWTVASGYASGIEVKGGERDIAEKITADGEGPIVLAGKKKTLDVTLKAVYTEGAAELAAVALSAYEGATPLYFRWSPKGGNSTNWSFVTSRGVVTNHVYAAGDAEKVEVAPIEVTIKCSTITKSVLA